MSAKDRPFQKGSSSRIAQGHSSFPLRPFAPRIGIGEDRKPPEPKFGSPLPAVPSILPPVPTSPSSSSTAGVAQRREEEEAEMIPDTADLPIRSHLPAASRPSVAVSNLRPELLQRRIKPIGEDDLKALEEKGEEIDPTYLDGLYSSDDKQLFLYAGGVSENLVAAEGRADRTLHLYARVEAVGEEDLDKALGDPSQLVLVSEDEKHTVTAQTLIERGNRMIRADFGTNLFQNMIFRLLSGEPKGGAGGAYANVEFRFKRAKGTLWTSLDEKNLPDERVQARYGQDVTVERISDQGLQLFVNVYLALNLPYQAERIGSNTELGLYSLFLAEGFEFVTEYESVQEALEGGGEDDHLSYLIAAREDSAGEIKPSIAAPDASPKVQDKTYTRAAVRGDRGTGQKAAMDNQSAADYVASLIGGSARLPALSGWEWLHLQASRLGGKNTKGNLVAGTYSANSRMIPVEREILALSRDADATHPVNVHWEASLQSVAGALTHIGETITVNVEAPRGTARNPSRVNFSYRFDASEGEAYTKLDRDKLDLLAKQSGGHPKGKNPLLEA